MDILEDKTERNLERWCLAEGIQFKDKSAEEIYKKRAKRIADAILLKVPDRVPVTLSFGMFPALANGLTYEEATFDRAKTRKAWMKTIAEFEPDLTFGSALASAGSLLEALDYRQLRLPGRGISPNSPFQFVEKEYVNAEEFYGDGGFRDDPSDFMLRVYLPRVCGILEPFRILPPFRTLFSYYLGIFQGLPVFGLEPVAAALEALGRAGAEAQRLAENSFREAMETMGMGFPAAFGGMSHAPFDTIGDFLRGTRGIMVDMYRRPDDLIEAMEKLVPTLIKMGVDQCNMSRNPLVGIPLHKGAEGFMSLEQFKTFYWPTLRKVMMGLIAEGCVPMPLFEGTYTSRLEIIRDIPKGMAIYWFEKVDIRRAKEILGDVACFKGNVPITLLCSGTPEQVKEYVKMLIDVVGKGGGLIVDFGAFLDEARYENVKMMVDFTKEYGIYQ